MLIASELTSEALASVVGCLCMVGESALWATGTRASGPRNQERWAQFCTKSGVKSSHQHSIEQNWSRGPT